MTETALREKLESYVDDKLRYYNLSFVSGRRRIRESMNECKARRKLKSVAGYGFAPMWLVQIIAPTVFRMIVELAAKWISRLNNDE